MCWFKETNEKSESLKPQHDFSLSNMFFVSFFSCFILLHRDTKQFILESENRSFRISNPHEFHRLAVMLHQVLWLFFTHVAAHVAARTLWRRVSTDCCDAIPLQNNRAPPTSCRGGSLLLALLRLLHHLSGTFRNKCHCLLFKIVVYQFLFRRKQELMIFFFSISFLIFWRNSLTFVNVDHILPSYWCILSAGLHCVSSVRVFKLQTCLKSKVVCQFTFRLQQASRVLFFVFVCKARRCSTRTWQCKK